MSRRRLWLISLGAVLGVCGAVLLIELRAIVWIGSYKTQLQIRSHRTAPIKQVTWDLGFHADEVQYAVERYSAGGTEVYWDFRHPAVPLPNDGIVQMEGRCGGRESPLRILSNSRVYERYVILKIEYADGLILYRAAEVDPEHRDRIPVVVIAADAVR